MPVSEAGSGLEPQGPPDDKGAVAHGKDIAGSDAGNVVEAQQPRG